MKISRSRLRSLILEEWDQDDPTQPRLADMLSTDRRVREYGPESDSPGDAVTDRWGGQFMMTDYNKVADLLFRNTDAAENEETMNLIIGFLLAMPESENSGFRDEYSNDEIGSMQALIRPSEETTRRERRQARRDARRGSGEAALEEPSYSERIQSDDYYARISSQTMPIIKGGRIKFRIKSDKMDLIDDMDEGMLKELEPKIREELGKIGLSSIISESRTVEFTRKALRRRILREFYGRADDEFGTVRVTRSDLNRVIVEEFGLSGMIGSGVSKVKGMLGMSPEETAGPPTEMTSVPVTDVEKVHAALQIGDPESDPGFMDVMARRMEDMNVLNDEYAAHLSSIGQAGDLVSSLEGAGLVQQARAMMGHIKGQALSSGGRKGMLQQMIREELSFFLSEDYLPAGTIIHSPSDHAAAMKNITPQASDTISAMPPVRDPSPGPFVDPQASVKFSSDALRDAISGLGEADDADEVDDDEIIEIDL